MAFKYKEDYESLINSTISRSYNITPAMLSEIVNELKSVFGNNVVVIGGRATNIYCAKDKRPTDDLDIVVKTKMSPEEAFNKLVEHNFIQEKKNINKDMRFVQFLYGSTGIKVDIYILYEGEKREEWPISGIPKSDIIKNALDIELSNKEKVKVVDPVRLVLMKLNAGRPKDYQDIANIISHVYGSFEKFLNGTEKLPGAKKIIENYLKEKLISEGKKIEEASEELSERYESIEYILRSIYEKYQEDYGYEFRKLRMA
jgi:hypothetical protein